MLNISIIARYLSYIKIVERLEALGMAYADIVGAQFKGLDTFGVHVSYPEQEAEGLDRGAHVIWYALFNVLADHGIDIALEPTDLEILIAEGKENV